MSLKDFYNSEKWRALRLQIMAERARERGGLICEYCHEPILKPYECIAHHKKELTEDNYFLVDISLNPKNIMLVHHHCHQKIHKKFGAGVCKKVYLVWGAPLSGKTTFVKDNMQYGDLVLDQDNLYQAISGQPRYIRPQELTTIVFNMRRAIEEAITMRAGQWQSAYIIGSYASSLERKRVVDRFGAEEIFINTSKEECLKRLEADSTRDEVRDEWRGYIEQWFNDYEIYN